MDLTATLSIIDVIVILNLNDTLRSDSKNSSVWFYKSYDTLINETAAIIYAPSQKLVQ